MSIATEFTKAISNDLQKHPDGEELRVALFESGDGFRHVFQEPHARHISGEFTRISPWVTVSFPPLAVSAEDVSEQLKRIEQDERAVEAYAEGRRAQLQAVRRKLTGAV